MIWVWSHLSLILQKSSKIRTLTWLTCFWKQYLKSLRRYRIRQRCNNCVSTNWQSFKRSLVSTTHKAPTSTANCLRSASRFCTEHGTCWSLIIGPITHNSEAKSFKSSSRFNLSTHWTIYLKPSLLSCKLWLLDTSWETLTASVRLKTSSEQLVR